MVHVSNGQRESHTTVDSLFPSLKLEKHTPWRKRASIFPPGGRPLKEPSEEVLSMGDLVE
jgi:hypothetical protein